MNGEAVAKEAVKILNGLEFSRNRRVLEVGNYVVVTIISEGKKGQMISADIRCWARMFKEVDWSQLKITVVPTIKEDSFLKKQYSLNSEGQLRISQIPSANYRIFAVIG